jgi:hypothetical protein
MTPQNPGPAAVDPQAIRAIVEEVVRRIRSESVVISAPAAAAAPRSPAAPATFTGKVITLDVVERLPAGTARLTIAERAVVTPSARDRAKERRISIERSGPAAGPSSGRPLIVAFADAGPDAAGRAAEIVRAVPRASQLPATGLADVIHSIATHASRDAARAILLTTRPAAAVVLANRSASLRGVTGRDAAGLLVAAAECGANLLVVRPSDFAAAALGRLATDFAGRDMPVPNELAATPAGCGCNTHPH